MCYETLLTMLTYGNWCYADEDPLAKRRKTSKADSNKTKEQTNQTPDSNDMTRSHKPLVAVRKIMGDRLSKSKNRSENSSQDGDVSINVRREANNPCCIQGYLAPHPSLMFGVRDVRNVWPETVQVQNEPLRYEYRPSTIARPYPLRIPPVFNLFPNQLAHTGWVRASVSSAFTPVRHLSPECQTSIVTTEPVVTGHSSSIQSLSDMVCSVTPATSSSSSEAHSASSVFTSVRSKSSESSQSMASKPEAQPTMTVPPASVQARESPKVQPSHIPVQTIMYSPSLRKANQTACSVTTTVTTSSAEDLSVRNTFSTTRIISSGSSTSQTFAVTTPPITAAHSSSIQSSSSVVGSVTDTTSSSAEDLSVRNTFSTTRIISPGSSTSQTFTVTTQPIMDAHSSSIQSSRSMVGSVTDTTSSSAEDLSINTSRIISSGSSQSQDPKPTAQPSSTLSSFNQTQEPPKFHPPHIPVQTIMYSPPSSLRALKQSLGSVTTTTTAFKTSSNENPTGNSIFSTASIKSHGSPTSVVTTQSVMSTHLSTIQAQEPQKFQPSHIPVQTIMYSPSLRAANRSSHSVTTDTTTTITTSSAEELSTNSTSATARIVSSRSSKSQDSESTAQPITTTSSSSIQPQESPKFRPSHIPVQTIMYSPSLRGKSKSACSVPTSTTVATTQSDEEFSTSTARIISPGSSTTQTFGVTTQPIMATKSSSIPSQGSVIGSCMPSTTTSSAEDRSSSSTAGIMSSGSSKAQDSKPTAQLITSARPSSLRSLNLTKPHSSELAPEKNKISSPPFLQSEKSTKSQTPKSTTQSTATISLSSAQPTASSNSQNPKRHILLLSPSSSAQSSEASTSQTTTQPVTIPPSYSLLSPKSPKTKTPKISSHLLFLPPQASVRSSEPSASQAPTKAAPSPSLQSSGSKPTQASKHATHLLLLSPPTSVQSSEASTSPASKPTTQTTAPSSSHQSSESTTTQASKRTTHLLLLSPPKTIKPPEPSKPSKPPKPSKPKKSSLTKLLLISPPLSKRVAVPTTPTTPSSSTGGESWSEADLDLEETVIQSVVGAIKVDIPDTRAAPKKRKEDEVNEKDALLQRMYSVPAFGGKTVKSAGLFKKMLTKEKLCHLFKCMASDCSFTCNQKALFDRHMKMHEARVETQKETSKDSTGEGDELNDWQQCPYCCDSPVYQSLSEHIITEHGYCMYQCAYCFYRALFQNYVDIHQTLAHRNILKRRPQLIYKCKAFSKEPTLANAVKKLGRKRCVKPYRCDQCGRDFLIIEEFMNHLLKEHQSVTSYTCHICKNVCFKPDRLVVHYKLHAYSTYQCAYCLHGTETEQKMVLHLCTFHFTQPPCLYVRVWDEGKQVQSEDKSKKVKNKTKCTNQLDCLKMISYDIEAICGESRLEDASDDESGDEDRLVIDESQELNDIIAELGITTETEPSGEGSPVMPEHATMGNGSSENVSVSSLLPNAKFSLESETGAETVLLSCGSSSNSSSN